MAFSEHETRRYERILQEFIDQHGPQGHIRLKLRWGFKIDGQSVELLGIRPKWNDPTQKISSGYAKATYVKKDKSWKVYLDEGRPTLAQIYALPQRQDLGRISSRGPGR